MDPEESQTLLLQILPAPGLYSFLSELQLVVA